MGLITKEIKFLYRLQERVAKDEIDKEELVGSMNTLLHSLESKNPQTKNL